MRGVFVSYRRDDSATMVARIEAALREAFDDLPVFVDRGGIEPGEDYIKVLRYHVEQDLIFLAVIGPQWQGGPKGKFRSRLHDPDDMVTREIKWRLKNWRSEIIPVLVNGASMPDRAWLPDSIAGLVNLNAVTLTDADFVTGIATLTKRINKLLLADAEIDQSLAELEREAARNPVPRQPAGPGVPAFQLAGIWTCDVQGPSRDSLTGQLGHMVVTFETHDRGMTGSIAWPGSPIPPEAIEGEAFLVKEHEATLSGQDRCDRVLLQGVVGRARSFVLEIPVHAKLGKIYHGTDSEGRQYALRLVRASGTRYGF